MVYVTFSCDVCVIRVVHQPHSQQQLGTESLSASAAFLSSYCDWG